MALRVLSFDLAEPFLHYCDLYFLTKGASGYAFFADFDLLLNCLKKYDYGFISPKILQNAIDKRTFVLYNKCWR